MWELKQYALQSLGLVLKTYPSKAEPQSADAVRFDAQHGQIAISPPLETPKWCFDSSSGKLYLLIWERNKAKQQQTVLPGSVAKPQIRDKRIKLGDSHNIFVNYGLFKLYFYDHFPQEIPLLRRAILMFLRGETFIPMMNSFCVCLPNNWMPVMNSNSSSDLTRFEAIIARLTFNFIMGKYFEFFTILWEEWSRIMFEIWYLIENFILWNKYRNEYWVTD